MPGLWKGYSLHHSYLSPDPAGTNKSRGSNPRPLHPEAIQLEVVDSVLHIFRRQRGVNQYQPPQHFSKAARLRVAVQDTRVGYALRVKPKEVNVLSDHDTSCRGRECEMLPI
jgi:hypothetical protein